MDGFIQAVLRGGIGEVGRVAAVVYRAVATSPDGAALGLALLLIAGVAVFAGRTLAPGPLPGEWQPAPPRPRRAPAPARPREVYRPPAPRGFPARAYEAAHNALMLRAAPRGSGTKSLLDETGLMPMVYTGGH